MYYPVRYLPNVISVEGLEGSGKTTIARMIENSGILLNGIAHKVIYSREPGGVETAERIRDIVVNNEMYSITEMLLYAAARSEHYFTKIKPFIETNHNKDIMILDRFIDSSFAIQGYARGIGFDRVYNVNMTALDGNIPSLTIYLDIDVKTGLTRANKRSDKNKFETYDEYFHNRVREGFFDIPHHFKDRSYCIVNTINKTIQEVYNECIKIITNHLRVR